MEPAIGGSMLDVAGGSHLVGHSVAMWELGIQMVLLEGQVLAANINSGLASQGPEITAPCRVSSLGGTPDARPCLLD
jgi:hypothetical protein